MGQFTSYGFTRQNSPRFKEALMNDKQDNETLRVLIDKQEEALTCMGQELEVLKTQIKMN